MAFQVDDTIVAIASPRGSGARGIVRLSGPQVIECLQDCFLPDQKSAGSADGDAAVQAVTAGGIAVLDVETVEPSLEDVFIHLVGTEMSEGSPGA